MKALRHILIITMFCSCISMQNCNLFSNNDPKPKTELEKLPPATQEGKETFGCLVNGKAWYTKSIVNATADYQLGSLGIGGTVYEPTESIGFDLTESEGDPVLNTGTYSLLSSSQYSPIVTVFKSLNCMYGGSSNGADLISGQLTITKFDKVNYIISGLFEFTVTHAGCETLIITNGRFDMHYAP
jgi:hypothetical protein